MKKRSLHLKTNLKELIDDLNEIAKTSESVFSSLLDRDFLFVFKNNIFLNFLNHPISKNQKIIEIENY